MDQVRGTRLGRLRIALAAYFQDPNHATTFLQALPLVALPSDAESVLLLCRVQPNLRAGGSRGQEVGGMRGFRGQGARGRRGFRGRPQSAAAAWSSGELPKAMVWETEPRVVSG